MNGVRLGLAIASMCDRVRPTIDGSGRGSVQIQISNSIHHCLKYGHLSSRCKASVRQWSQTMPRSRTLMTAQVLLVVLGGFSFSSQYAISQQAPFTLTSNRFEDYFNALATTQGAGTSRSEAALESLAESIGSMTPAEIAAGVSTIDRQIDNTAEDQNPWAKPQAAFLLKIIAGRSDGPHRC